MDKRMLGVMQGRLLPKYQGRYQAFPADRWVDEFALAQELGLDCIEFILDSESFLRNPLMSEEGLEKIKNLISQTGVQVKSICADYFMNAPMHGVDQERREESLNVLQKLIDGASEVGVKDIVIPCVDQSSFKEDIDIMKEFSSTLKKALSQAKDKNVRLSIEADLPPKMFRYFLKEINSTQVTINYDSGNSASLGFDIREEFETFSEWISSVHIKDRTEGGGPVVLGEGDVDFDAFFQELAKIKYDGPLIMQAYRDDEGLAIFKQQLGWIKEKYEKYFTQLVR